MLCKSLKSQSEEQKPSQLLRMSPVQRLLRKRSSQGCPHSPTTMTAMQLLMVKLEVSFN